VTTHLDCPVSTDVLLVMSYPQRAGVIEEEIALRPYDKPYVREANV